jgi:hypothetical protein
MGRPPIGERAMSPAEKQRRYRERKFGNKPPVTKPATAKLAEEQAARIAELEAELAEFRNKDTVTKSSTMAKFARERAKLQREVEQLKAALAARSSGLTKARVQGRPGGLGDLSEVGTLQRRIKHLKLEIARLKAALAEEPDMAKLRLKAVDQAAQIRQLQQQVRKVVKERDQYQIRWKSGAQYLLTAENFRVLVKAVHPDRAKNTSPGEMAAAERIVIALRPLFIESGK